MRKKKQQKEKVQVKKGVGDLLACTFSFWSNMF
jgi:hypothetical protein